MERTRRKIICFLFLLALVTAPLYAEVYTLWPFRNKPADLSLFTEQNRPKKFWTEQIRVNGKDLTLEIFLLDMKLTDLAKMVSAGLAPEIQVMHGAQSMLLQEKQQDGSMKRVYYLALTGIQPVLQFQMRLPAERLKPSRQDWPALLPYMEDAEDVTCMEFPVRNAFYGAFQIKERPLSAVLEEAAAKITALGWERVSRETDQVFAGKGEVFMKNNPQSILILGVNGESGSVRVSMYARPL